MGSKPSKQSSSLSGEQECLELFDEKVKNEYDGLVKERQVVPKWELFYANKLQERTSLKCIKEGLQRTRYTDEGEEEVVDEVLGLFPPKNDDYEFITFKLVVYEPVPHSLLEHVAFRFQTFGGVHVGVQIGRNVLHFFSHGFCEVRRWKASHKVALVAPLVHEEGIPLGQIRNTKAMRKSVCEAILHWNKFEKYEVAKNNCQMFIRYLCEKVGHPLPSYYCNVAANPFSLYVEYLRTLKPKKGDSVKRILFDPNTRKALEFGEYVCEWPSHKKLDKFLHYLETSKNSKNLECRLEGSLEILAAFCRGWQMNGDFGKSCGHFNITFTTNRVYEDPEQQKSLMQFYAEVQQVPFMLCNSWSLPRQTMKGGVRILCLDGGGMRGIFALEVLKELELKMMKPIFQMFDVICGTSTGSIIAACLVYHQMPVIQIFNMYMQLGEEAFGANACGQASNVSKRSALELYGDLKPIVDAVMDDYPLEACAYPKFFAVASTSDLRSAFLFNNFNKEDDNGSFQTS